MEHRHHRRKGTRSFVFYFEGGARQFAEFLEEWGVKYKWVIDLSRGENIITVSRKEEQ